MSSRAVFEAEFSGKQSELLPRGKA